MIDRHLQSLVKKSIDDARSSNKRELYLDGALFTGLEEIPSEVFELTDLKNLSVSGGFVEKTRIKNIPPAIAKLQCLETLTLNNNQIQELPKELFELKNLRQLSLGKNEITHLPKEIGNLKGLRKLDLSQNQLRALPAEIAELNNLETLDLNENLLTRLPLEIGKLGTLIRLSLHENHIENVPLEILNQSSSAIINYCRSVLEEQVTRLYEAKLLIVGEGGVGKTCLLKRVVYDSFNEGQITTEGIDIHRWNISTDSISNFRVNIWDFGGQEIYHATHQFFLTKRSLYLFVWSARNDEVNFDYWLNIIRLLSNNSPLVVVLNKVDERVKMLDEQFIQKRFGNVVGFYRVSALNGTGIRDLVKRIHTEIVSLEHVGNVLPKVWVQIRELLERLDKNYIDYEEYKSICTSYELNNEQADFLSQYYHDLGVLLHFQDNPVLKNILFLKPEWATNAVYKIVDTKDVIKNFGKFHFSELRVIWNEYPEDKHLHLVELMKKFELCFQIPDTNEYIIPELLQPSAPKLDWNYEKNIRFEYNYDFMPSGILTRFIVINHHLIYKDFYWKNGAIFVREDNKALVISDPFNRKIQVWVDGRHKQEMLSIVREKFDYIHKTLNNPAVRQMIKCICSECDNDRDPFFYEYATLKNFYNKGKKEIPCARSAEDVSIEQLLGGIEGTKAKAEEEILEILRTIKSKYDADEETLMKKANEIIQLKPSFMGFGININEIIKRFLAKEKKEAEDSEEEKEQLRLNP